MAKGLKSFYKVAIICLFVVIMVFTSACSCSCSYYFGRENINYNDIKWEEVDFNALDAKMAEFADYKNKSSSALRSTENYIVNAINEIGYYYGYAHVEYCKDITSEFAQKQNQYLSAYNKYLGEYYEICYAISNSTEHPNYYSEQEKAYIAQQYNPGSDRISEINSRVNEISIEYMRLDPSESGYTDEVYELYMESIDLNNELATLYGYDNYVDFAYENIYGYYFDSSDAAKYFSDLKAAMPAAYTAVANKWNESKLKLTNADKVTISTYDINKNFGSFEKVVKKHAEKVGNPMQEALGYMLDYDYYYITDAGDNKAYNGSYVTNLSKVSTPYMFINNSGNIGTVSTFVHELGHYSFNYAANGGYVSYDFAETHSQTNELLFMYSYSSLFSQNVADYMETYEQYSLLGSSVIYGAIIAEFEREMYLNSDAYTSAADLTDYFGELYNSYESFDINDNFELWAQIPHIITSPMYYISYSVSGLSAFNIYSEYLADNETGLSKYRKLLSEDNVNKGYDKVLQSIGLGLPTDKNTIDNVANTLVSRYSAA